MKYRNRLISACLVASMVSGTVVPTLADPVDDTSIQDDLNGSSDSGGSDPSGSSGGSGSSDTGGSDTGGSDTGGSDTGGSGTGGSDTGDSGAGGSSSSGTDNGSSSGDLDADSGSGSSSLGDSSSSSSSGTDNGSGSGGSSSGTDNGSGSGGSSSGTDNGSGSGGSSSGTDNGSGSGTDNGSGSGGSGTDNGSGSGDSNSGTDNGSGTGQTPDTPGDNPSGGTGQTPGGENPQPPVVETPHEVSRVSSYSVNAKANADATSIKQDMVNDLLGKTYGGHKIKTVAQVGKATTNGSSGGSLILYITYDDKNFETLTANYTFVSPDNYEFKGKVPSISADSDYNKTASALLTYINNNSEIIGTGTEYEEAFGTPTKTLQTKLTWTDCDKVYDPAGTTYTFTIMLETGKVLVREVVVDPVSVKTPDVSIDYDTNEFKGTDAKMEYSINKTKWVACKANMSIPKECMDKTVYFRYPETSYYQESKIQSLDVPEQAEAPTTKMDLTSTSHSITIENCWDFSNVEFSIDDEHWKSTSNETYTFKNLDDDKSYNVYVRTKAKEGSRLHSESKKQSITTEEKAENGIKVTYKVTSGVGNVTGTADIYSELDDNVLEGSLDSSDFNQFKSIISGYVDKYRTTNAELIIQQFIESGDKGDVEEIQFKMPVSQLKEAANKANLELTYECDWLTFRISNDELRHYVGKSSSSFTSNIQKIEEKPSSSFLKSYYNSDRPIYKVSVKFGSSKPDVTYEIPYRMSNDETMRGLKVLGVTSSNKTTEIPFEYDSRTGSIKFTTDFEGYIVIDHEYTTETVPFYDVPINHWAYTSIEYCYNKGIFVGTSNTMFSPNAPVTKAMIFSLLSRMSDLDITEKVDKVTFTDIKTTDWFAPSAEWAKANKLVSGSKFDPNSPMTRAEIAVVLYNFLKMNGYDGKIANKNSYDDFTDLKDVDSKAKTAIGYLKEIGLMFGTSSTTFDPNSSVSRCQMAALIYRLDTMILNR